MPFQAPWRAYQNWDLLYGLADARHHLAKQFNCLNHTYTIDQYDTFTLPRGANGLRYDPAFVASLALHPRFRVAVGYDFQDDDNWHYDPVGAAARARRKCKGGLRWITQNTNRHIHFLIDEVDLLATANKNLTTYAGVGEDPVGKAPLNRAWDTKLRSITGEELRWVYRFRLNARVRAQIQFWKAAHPKFQNTGHGRWERRFVPCPPPWNDPLQPAAVRGAWAAYNPTAQNVPLAM